MNMHIVGSEKETVMLNIDLYVRQYVEKVEITIPE